MISAQNVTKKFDSFTALDNLSCNIPESCIYGLVGSNGAGKSTFLRLLCGVYKADSGIITVDGQPVYENPTVKANIAYVPDDLYFPHRSTIKTAAKHLRLLYPNFDLNRLNKLIKHFDIDKNAYINTFSKGMKRQTATILALSLCPEYLILDETFDGLDPIVRSAFKEILYEDVLENKTTVIISSHSLRELEDTCDNLALLHKGKIILESSIDNIKTSFCKVQIAFSTPFDQSLFDEMALTNYIQNGSVANFIVRKNADAVQERLKSLSPALLDILPLTLDEVFICEAQALGYNVGKSTETDNKE